jgi:hypothetical protein
MSLVLIWVLLPTVGRRPTLSADGKVDQPFSDINDPKGICMDVSRLGRWGNGDVEVEGYLQLKYYLM